MSGQATRPAHLHVHHHLTRPRQNRPGDEVLMVRMNYVNIGNVSVLNMAGQELDGRSMGQDY